MKRMAMWSSVVGALAIVGCGGNGLNPGRAGMGPADVEIAGVREEVQAFLDTISGKEVAHVVTHYSGEYYNDGRNAAAEEAAWSKILAKPDFSIRFADLTMRNGLDPSGGALAIGRARAIESVDGKMSESWVDIKLVLIKNKQGQWLLYGNQQPGKISFATSRTWRQMLGDTSQSSNTEAN